MTKVAVIGAAYSANKGAASMMQSLLDNLPARVDGVRIVAVSTHAGADRRAYAAAGLDVPVVSQAPVEMGLAHVPLALVAGLLRRLKLPYTWLLRPAGLRALHDADLVADLSGISFVDGRRFVVIVYNALVVWVPMLLGTPVVKCSQAMGPFKTRVNRLLAGFTLKRLARVCPRGSVTESYVRSLGLKNVTPAGDMAFTMQVPDDVREAARKDLAARGDGPYLTLSPSQVVATYCEGKDIPYPQIMADFIDRVGEATGLRVVMIAHSAQANKGVGHMNDLPLCRDIAALVRNPGNLTFFDDELMPTTLRAIIGESEAIVASRFHAMISALTEKVPPLVIGWSHKYGEVLAPFELAESAITYDELVDADTIVARTVQVLADRDAVIERIEQNLPAAQAASMTNFDVLSDELARAGQPAHR
ncbi:polysaccharide pyruvyl transferase family protein [Nakamurella lactea]|uniref:polysaccharide pyruvyl transferase family protein n=1 Tax=Nakamurella lactea TaxID=459515 RepID=UPI000414FC97|nr:polysaccharide pyruvyl transferase family protein [Nakamurella lactea]